MAQLMIKAPKPPSRRIKNNSPYFTAVSKKPNSQYKKQMEQIMIKEPRPHREESIRIHLILQHSVSIYPNSLYQKQLEQLMIKEHRPQSRRINNNSPYITAHCENNPIQYIKNKWNHK